MYSVPSGHFDAEGPSGEFADLLGFLEGEPGFLRLFWRNSPEFAGGDVEVERPVLVDGEGLDSVRSTGGRIDPFRMQSIFVATISYW